jgi:hypothetical protein
VEQENKVLLAKQAGLDIMEVLAMQASKDHKEKQAQWVLLVKQVPKVQLAKRVLMAQPD